jgi:hypothetical protein
MTHYRQNNLSFAKNKGFGEGVSFISNSDLGHPVQILPSKKKNIHLEYYSNKELL